MRLHENRDLFSDALQAASQPVEDGGLGIKSIFIEKDYWICRSLSLMAANDKDNRAIFKGGTSLTKAYGIGSRFSEDIDIAISEAWTLSGNQLKMLIKRTAKSMTKQVLVMQLSLSTCLQQAEHVQMIGLRAIESVPTITGVKTICCSDFIFKSFRFIRKATSIRLPFLRAKTLST